MEGRSIMVGTTAPAKPPTSVIAQYEKELARNRHCSRRHNGYGWAYDITAKVMLITGVTATAVAGVTAAADLLGKAIIGGIAMAAAVLTALGAALPWDKRAADHWKLAGKYARLAGEIERQITEDVEGLQVKEWLI